MGKKCPIKLPIRIRMHEECYCGYLRDLCNVIVFILGGIMFCTSNVPVSMIVF